MGVGELRDSFNAAAPGYSCTLALLDYERDGAAEWQILSFHGTDPQGLVFEAQSDRLGAGADLNAAAKATAEGLVVANNGNQPP